MYVPAYIKSSSRIKAFPRAEENFSRTTQSLDNDISYDVTPCVLSHQIFSPIQRSLLSRGRFQQRGWRRSNVSCNWCPMMRRKGKDLLNVLTCWTYLTYAHLLRTVLFSSCSLQFCSLFASTCVCENTRARVYTDVRKRMCRHTHAIAGTLENKRRRERERGELVNPHMCDDNREPPVEQRRYLPVRYSLLASHRERKL